MVTTTRTIQEALLPTGYVTFESLFDITQYPAGERHVHLRSDVEPGRIRTVEATVHNFDDLGLLVTAERITPRRARSLPTCIAGDGPSIDIVSGLLVAAEVMG